MTEWVYDHPKIATFDIQTQKLPKNYPQHQSLLDSKISFLNSFNNSYEKIIDHEKNYFRCHLYFIKHLSL